jgi:hypothetical protein
MNVLLIRAILVIDVSFTSFFSHFCMFCLVIVTEDGKEQKNSL